MHTHRFAQILNTHYVPVVKSINPSLSTKNLKYRCGKGARVACPSNDVRAYFFNFRLLNILVGTLHFYCFKNVYCCVKTNLNGRENGTRKT